MIKQNPCMLGIERELRNTKKIFDGFVNEKSLRKILFNLLFLRLILPLHGEDSRKALYNDNIKKPDICFDDIKKDPEKSIKGINNYLEENNTFLNGIFSHLEYPKEVICSNKFKDCLRELEKIDIKKCELNELWKILEKTFTKRYIHFNTLTNHFINLLLKSFIGKEKTEVYSPTCGNLGKYVDWKMFINKNTNFIGMENNKDNYEWLKIKLLLFGYFNTTFKNQDPINNTFLNKNGEMKKFSRIILILPLNNRITQNDNNVKLLYKNFKYNVFNKKNSDEFLLFLLSIEMLNENGKAFILIKRKKIENSTILKTMFNDDIIEAIIKVGIIPYTIFIINKKKQKSQKGRVLFADFTGYLRDIRKNRKIIDSKKIALEMVNIIQGRKKIPEIAKQVTLDEIRLNNFSIFPEKYLFTFKKIKKFNDIMNDLQKLDVELEKIIEKRNKLLKKLVDYEK